MKRIARAGMLTFCAALALILPSCGNEDKRSDDPLVQALLRSVEADAKYGVRATFRGSLSKDGETVRVRGYGQSEADERRSRVVMSAADQKTELITDEPFLLVDADTLAREAPIADKIAAGIRWFKINQDTVLSATGLGGIDNVQSLGPNQLLKYIADLDSPIQKDGSERIDGQLTTRYRVRVRFADVYEQIVKDAKDPPKLARALRDEELRFVFWIDGKDLVRRSRIRFASGQESFVMTANVTAYDRDLRVKVPRGLGVMDITDEVAKAARKEKEGDKQDEAPSGESVSS